MTLFALFREGLSSKALYGLIGATFVSQFVPFQTQRWLRARMSEERRERAWNDLTWAVAILWGGALSMVPFLWVTRDLAAPWPRLRALGLGLFWLVSTLLTSELLAAAILSSAGIAV